MELLKLIKYAVINEASDIHITSGIPPMLRKDGKLISVGKENLETKDIENLVNRVLDRNQILALKEGGDIDTSFAIRDVGRFRINIFKQRNSYAMAIRIIPLRIPTMAELGLPKVVKKILESARGLILVTGPTGSGKTTSLASMVKLISQEKRCHILTIEDPVEYLHKHNKSIVNQREIGTDAYSFATALRAALRQDPDVIMIGEMRDLETMSVALTAAETGHLILSTLHTIGAIKTIDRIIDVFPPYQQRQIKVQLSSVIQAIISQQLLPRKDGQGMIAAFELMIATPGIRNLIREGKLHQIDTSIQTGGILGMQTMDKSILNLHSMGIISDELALDYAVNRDIVEKNIF